MELIRIELENFRQFYGKQHIDFSNSGNRNITIIFGENGKGKTGIFRALMFGLFGDQLLEQDDPKGPAVHLVNFKSLEEKRDQVVRSEVSVRFKHNDQMYEIVRSVDGIMNGAGRIEEKINKPVLYKGEQDVLLRNNRITDELQIKNEMNCIFNGKIKKFFLFDGEKIDTLATTSKEARDEVKEAIITMTQINTLNDSINTLRRIKANEKKRINDKNNNYDLKAITNEIETLKEKKENKQSNLNDLKDNLDICLREINEFNEKISNSKELEENRKDINQVKDKIKSKKETLENIQKNIRSNLVDKGSSLLMGVYYLQEKQYLESVLKQHQNNVSIELLNLSLNSNRCVCCNNDLENDVMAKHYIENLIRNYTYNSSSDLVKIISNVIQDYNTNIIDIKASISDNLKNYSDNSQQLEILLNQLIVLEEKESLTAKEFENLNELKNSLRKNESEKDRFNREIGSIEGEIKSLDKEIEIKEREQEKILSSRDEYRKDYEVISTIQKLEEYLTDISNKYSGEMKIILSKEATDVFNGLIDSKDRGLISKIEINDKYEIVLKDIYGTTITQDISQGQRRIVSISFITALAKIASGSSARVEFPLFMDTPFGSISGNNRDNLIKNVPDLASQWILLLTDTELTNAEEFAFKSTNRLGCWYELDQIEKYHTVIKEKNIDEQMNKRG